MLDTTVSTEEKAQVAPWAAHTMYIKHILPTIFTNLSFLPMLVPPKVFP